MERELESILHGEEKMSRSRSAILAEFINNNKYKTYVEIGVSKGDNARFLLKQCPSLEKMYLIDPKNVYCTGWFEDQPKITFIKQASRDAHPLIPDNVDIVFIDGDHNYKAVLEDIRLYYPKINLNGIITGHDYVLKFEDCVRKAVDEFFGNGNFFTEQDDLGVFVWWKKLTSSNSII